MCIRSVQSPKQITPAQLRTHATQPPHGPIIELSPCQQTTTRGVEPLSSRKPSPTSHNTRTHPTEVDTTPKHRRIFPNSNFNWSPDVVLLRNQRTRKTPCDIITGAPLLTSKWILPQTQQQQHCWREGKKAPFLTMRERERHTCSSGTLNIVADHRSSSQIPALNSHQLVGSGSEMAYSRHSHKPIPPSSHTPILPSSHTLTLPGQKPCLEHRQSRWKM